jgi:hypothetical protein
MIKACKEFVEFKRLFFSDVSYAKRSSENKARMEKCYKFFDLQYSPTDKKRFDLISSSVKGRIKSELCVVCKQPRTEMVMPCQFLKADCGHFIDGNCRDKQLDVRTFFLV